MDDGYGSLSDSRLAACVRAGEPDAFVELSARYLWLIRAKAGQFTGPAAPEREDLFQEGFLGLYAAAMGFREGAGASFSTYAGVCVYNRMTSAARRHMNAGNRTLNESIPLEAAGELPIAAGGPQDLLELREGYAAMWQRIDKALTPLERKALELYLQGCRREEAPQRAGMAVKTFDNAMHRVRMKLKGLGTAQTDETD